MELTQKHMIRLAFKFRKRPRVFVLAPSCVIYKNKISSITNNDDSA